MTGWSLLFTMKAWGHTMFMISCSTNSEAAEVLMLNPARFSSSAMVAVPPEDDDAFVDAPLADGVMATTDRLRAAAASAAKADRFNNPFSPIALPCSSTAPVTAGTPRFLHVDVGRFGRKRNPIATFFWVICSGISAGSRRRETRSGAERSIAHGSCVEGVIRRRSVNLGASWESTA